MDNSKRDKIKILRRLWIVTSPRIGMTLFAISVAALSVAVYWRDVNWMFVAAQGCFSFGMAWIMQAYLRRKCRNAREWLDMS